jgi:hypothetical protein
METAKYVDIFRQLWRRTVPDLSDIGYEVKLEATHVASMGIDGGGSMKKGN